MSSKCISKLDQSQPLSSHPHGLQVYVQTRWIMASRYITEFNWIPASKCSPKLARSRPPGASLSSTCYQPPSAPLSYSIAVSKCFSNRAQSRHVSASLSYSIMASKCISKPGRSRPTSPSLSSTRSAHTIHDQTRSIAASKCISKFSESSTPGAPAITLQHHLLPDWPYVNI